MDIANAGHVKTFSNACELVPRRFAECSMDNLLGGPEAKRIVNGYATAFLNTHLAGRTGWAALLTPGRAGDNVDVILAAPGSQHTFDATGSWSAFCKQPDRLQDGPLIIVDSNPYNTGLFGEDRLRTPLRTLNCLDGTPMGDSTACSWVREWLVAGPYEVGPENTPWDPGCGRLSDPEDAIFSTAFESDPSGIPTAHEAGWAKQDVFFTTLRLFDERDFFFAYAAFYVHNEGEPREAVLAFASDDSVAIWIDPLSAQGTSRTHGDPAACFSGGRWYGEEGVIQNRTTITIPSGTSLVLAKVTDGSFGSGIRLRFEEVGTDHQPLADPNISWSLNPRR